LILLDTNVVSETMRVAPEPTVIGWLDAQVAETLYLSTVSLAELLYGVAALPKGRRKSDLERSLSDHIMTLFADRLLTFDAAAATAYATAMSRAQRAGRRIGVADGQIAAIAAAHRFAVASRDTKPFEAAGVPVIDPWTQ
jgi:predicted nucleic acid-binding protein